MTPFTTALTMLVNAAPITTATARSTTFPRIRKALKPCHTDSFFSLTFGPHLAYTVRAAKRLATYGNAGRACPTGSLRRGMRRPGGERGVQDGGGEGVRGGGHRSVRGGGKGLQHRVTASRAVALAPASSAATGRGTERTTRAPASFGTSASGSGTSRTRAPRATTRTLPPVAGSSAAMTSTRSRGRSSRTVAASEIRTGAETLAATARAVRAGGRSPVAAGAAREAGVRSGWPRERSLPSRGPAATSAAAVTARPTATARLRCRASAGDPSSPARTRTGGKCGTSQGGGTSAPGGPETGEPATETRGGTEGARACRES